MSSLTKKSILAFYIKNNMTVLAGVGTQRLLSSIPYIQYLLLYLVKDRLAFYLVSCILLVVSKVAP